MATTINSSNPVMLSDKLVPTNRGGSGVGYSFIENMIEDTATAAITAGTKGKW